MEYLARLSTEGTRTLVEFPDCPGCQTFGKNRAEALRRAREAVEGWLEAHLVGGEAPPPPSPRSGRPGSRSALIAISPVLSVRLELRWARQGLGLSQGDLAKRIGVTRQQIALLESPDSNVTLRTLERVARAMDLRLDIRLRRAGGAAA
jgi:predicted RNase H-like HicB family nuclease/DNA-binding XRE family transcriptional regulator